MVDRIKITNPDKKSQNTSEKITNRLSFPLGSHVWMLWTHGRLPLSWGRHLGPLACLGILDFLKGNLIQMNMIIKSSLELEKDVGGEEVQASEVASLHQPRVGGFLSLPGQSSS